MDRLTDDEVRAHLKELPDWQLEEKAIRRRYNFKTFKAAMDFTNEVARMAEERNHHPFIAIDYRVVTLRLTSWHAGGLTMQDFDEAKEFDGAYESRKAST